MSISCWINLNDVTFLSPVVVVQRIFGEASEKNLYLSQLIILDTLEKCLAGVSLPSKHPQLNFCRFQAWCGSRIYADTALLGVFKFKYLGKLISPAPFYSPAIQGLLASRWNHAGQTAAARDLPFYSHVPRRPPARRRVAGIGLSRPLLAELQQLQRCFQPHLHKVFCSSVRKRLWLLRVETVDKRRTTVRYLTSARPPQVTGADGVPRGQRGRSRHRADAVHQRGLLQTEEAPARSAHFLTSAQPFVTLPPPPLAFLKTGIDAPFQKPRWSSELSRSLPSSRSSTA